MRDARTWLLVISSLAIDCSRTDAAPVGPSPPSGSDAGDLAVGPGPASTSPTPVTDGGDAAAPTSTGCASKTTFAKGSVTVFMDWAKQIRTARVHVPTNVDSTKPSMLVLNFHGLGSDATQEELVTQMTASSDARGFIVAYPQGIGQSWNAGNCCGTALGQKVDDVGFVRALITKLETDYCIDPKRVFATGWSNGGHFSYRLACDMADVFGGVASVAGVLLNPRCSPSRAIPILDFHGTADPIVAYGGGGPNAGFPGAAQSVAAFAATSGCGGATPTTIMTKGDTTCVRTPGCSADLELCTIADGGHTWLGGIPLPIFGKTSNDVKATEMILDFFDKHPLP